MTQTNKKLYGDELTVAISEGEEAKMTITLAPETEAKLREMATREGRDESTLADALLAEVLEEANGDFEEACEAVSESLAGDPKHDVSLEEYRAQFDLEREVRQRKREGKKDKVAA